MVNEHDLNQIAHYMKLLDNARDEIKMAQPDLAEAVLDEYPTELARDILGLIAEMAGALRETATDLETYVEDLMR